MLIKFDFFVEEALLKMENNEEVMRKLACLFIVPFSIFEKNLKSQFFVIPNLVTFGTYSESQPNSRVTNLVRDFTYVESFKLITCNLHELVCLKNL